MSVPPENAIQSLMEDKAAHEITAGKAARRGLSWGRIFLIFSVLAVILLAGAYWWTQHYIYAAPIKTTKLTAQEQAGLEWKLERLQGHQRPAAVIGADGRPLIPEPYSEEGASRELVFSEREINALVARDPQLARHVAVDLSPNLVSVTALIPIEEDFPLLGGKTLRLRLGVNLAYQAGAPVVALQGVSLGGIPLPNAWLNHLKHKNLVAEFSPSGGFWQTFAAGIEDLQVAEGQVRIRLNR